jgi:hypothetical protein
MDTTGAPGHAQRRLPTRADVARLFEVAPATVARWSREGKRRFMQTPGGQRRYPRGNILELIGRSGEWPSEGPLPGRRSLS